MMNCEQFFTSQQTGLTLLLIASAVQCQKMSGAQDFPYTSFGVATVALTSALVTSLVWIFVCCTFYCCYWKKCRTTKSFRNSTVVSQDFAFLERTNGTQLASTNSTIPVSYSVSSLATSHAFNHSSLESILGVGES